MNQDYDLHLEEAKETIEESVDLEALKKVEVELLGKQSVTTKAKRSLGGLESEKRRELGLILNETRAKLEEMLKTRKMQLESEVKGEQLENERLDLTEFDLGHRLGHRHVVTQTWERLEDLFIGMGYTVSEGPEIEDEWHNFGALNFPLGHPARDMYDTLYVEYGEPMSTLLRTHTSPVQIRVMEEEEPANLFNHARKSF